MIKILVAEIKARIQFSGLRLSPQFVDGILLIAEGRRDGENCQR